MAAIDIGWAVPIILGFWGFGFVIVVIYTVWAMVRWWRDE